MGGALGEHWIRGTGESDRENSTVFRNNSKSIKVQWCLLCLRNKQGVLCTGSGKHPIFNTGRVNWQMSGIAGGGLDST